MRSSGRFAKVRHGWGQRPGRDGLPSNIGCPLIESDGERVREVRGRGESAAPRDVGDGQFLTVRAAQECMCGVESAVHQ
jgi:hypothetical protein